MSEKNPTDAKPKHYHNSGAELASRSDKELRDELHGSFPGGTRWQGLTFELARRGAEKQDKLLKITLGVSVAALVVGLAGVIATVLAS